MSETQVLVTAMIGGLNRVHLMSAITVGCDFSGLNGPSSIHDSGLAHVTSLGQ